MYRIRFAFLPILFVILFLASLSGCTEQTVSSDPSLKLTFSKDTVCFDTVFTGMGSSTQTVMIYNRNKNAIVIDNITIRGKWFRINIDGENDLNRLHDITLNGNDSLYLFIKANVEEQSSDMPVLVEDTVWFTTNSNLQHIALQAIGRNVEMIRTSGRKTVIDNDFTFSAAKPYLVYDTLVINGKAVFAEGSTLYMHQGANLILQGGVSARGTMHSPVRITGDRLDRLFEHVPYRAASGQWGGVYLLQPDNTEPHRDTLNHTEILSGNIGLYCSSEKTGTLPSLCLTNSLIHNQAAYGIVLQNTDAEIWNTEISNCASYCIFCEGGTHTLTHNTIASFFGWPYTNINIHNVSRQDVPALYINNREEAPNPTCVSIRNCIITGARANCIGSANELTDDYKGEIYGNYIKADTIKTAFSHDNVYANDSDILFVNTYYKYREYVYYDFRLDSMSAALCIGDSVLAQQERYITDREGISRKEIKPDAGCYQRVEK